MESREDLPRVSVGSVHDWQKVRANFKDAATSQLQERIAASKTFSQETDAIMAHLDQFIERTFSLAQPNLRINGTNFESLDENGRETDPFDETLDRRIWSLADTRLQWHKRIAETRRTVPTEIESTLSVLLERHRELDATLLPVGSEEITEEDSTAEEDILRQQRIEQALQNTSALANELDQTVSRQQERGDRVKVIVMEVKSLKP
ncbi:hypothetical protein GALMADRAFT_89324 [Galerina marginata CBS 339.88]|uniref:Uncharacterized protein n=1 Tax=Galerina marginata (strain CBS 339.88) TaxID=685588 RepID=A0A067TE53_GALM3|nr:hypothetical protein GALMADRAFT_89324 [Galerina marginata CBS 339.88]